MMSQTRRVSIMTSRISMTLLLVLFALLAALFLIIIITTDHTADASSSSNDPIATAITPSPAPPSHDHHSCGYSAITAKNHNDSSSSSEITMMMVCPSISSSQPRTIAAHEAATELHSFPAPSPCSPFYHCHCYSPQGSRRGLQQQQASSPYEDSSIRHRHVGDEGEDVCIIGVSGGIQSFLSHHRHNKGRWYHDSFLLLSTTSSTALAPYDPSIADPQRYYRRHQEDFCSLKNGDGRQNADSASSPDVFHLPYAFTPPTHKGTTSLQALLLQQVIYDASAMTQTRVAAAHLLLLRPEQRFPTSSSSEEDDVSSDEEIKEGEVEAELLHHKSMMLWSYLHYDDALHDGHEDDDDEEEVELTAMLLQKEELLSKTTSVSSNQEDQEEEDGEKDEDDSNILANSKELQRRRRARREAASKKKWFRNSIGSPHRRRRTKFHRSGGSATFSTPQPSSFASPSSSSSDGQRSPAADTATTKNFILVEDQDEDDDDDDDILVYLVSNLCFSPGDLMQHLLTIPVTAGAMKSLFGGVFGFLFPRPQLVERKVASSSSTSPSSSKSHLPQVVNSVPVAVVYWEVKTLSKIPAAAAAPPPPPAPQHINANSSSSSSSATKEEGRGKRRSRSLIRSYLHRTKATVTTPSFLDSTLFNGLETLVSRVLKDVVGPVLLGGEHVILTVVDAVVRFLAPKVRSSVVKQLPSTSKTSPSASSSVEAHINQFFRCLSNMTQACNKIGDAIYLTAVFECCRLNAVFLYEVMCISPPPPMKRSPSRAEASSSSNSNFSFWSTLKNQVLHRRLFQNEILPRSLLGVLDITSCLVGGVIVKAYIAPTAPVQFLSSVAAWVVSLLLGYQTVEEVYSASIFWLVFLVPFAIAAGVYVFRYLGAWLGAHGIVLAHSGVCAAGRWYYTTSRGLGGRGGGSVRVVS